MCSNTWQFHSITPGLNIDNDRDISHYIVRCSISVAERHSGRRAAAGGRGGWAYFVNGQNPE